jgi:YGGT family
MLNNQDPASSSNSQPSEVVVRTDKLGTTVEPVQAPVESTRVEVRPGRTVNNNELAVDQGGPIRVSQEGVRERRFTVGKIVDYVWYVLAVLEVFLAARFFFELTAAGPAAGFVKFIYAVTQPFVWPFNGIFGSPQSGNNVFDANILIAMAVYAVIAWGITRLLVMTIEPPSVR